MLLNWDDGTGDFTFPVPSPYSLFPAPACDLEFQLKVVQLFARKYLHSSETTPGRELQK